MDPEKLEGFRSLLTERLSSLLRETARTGTDITEGEESPGDLTDQASVERDRNLVFRVQDREWKLAQKIRDALGRIENGTYGICEGCGKNITDQRLRVRPVTTLCIDCKTSQEADERRRGE